MKKIIICISVILVIGVIVGLIIFLPKGKSITCKKVTNESGFEIRDNIKFDLKDDKVFKVYVTKEVEIKTDDVDKESFLKAIQKTLESAYNYASENAFEIETNMDTKTISLVMNSKKYGVILDNLKVSKNDESLNYTFNAINNIDTEKNAIKIGDKFTKEELKNKAKEVGYTCD